MIYPDQQVLPLTLGPHVQNPKPQPLRHGPMQVLEVEDADRAEAEIGMSNRYRWLDVFEVPIAQRFQFF